MKCIKWIRVNALQRANSNAMQSDPIELNADEMRCKMVQWNPKESDGTGWNWMELVKFETLALSLSSAGQGTGALGP